ncbi:MAG: hypothetical protein JW797_11725 [Bradymonadales bacterium]|nr:hypothetical protein [Bradymonadales bacterium]
MLDLFRDFNDANLLFLGSVDGWVLWLLAVLALAILALSFVDLADLSWPRRISLTGLRGLTFAAALLLLTEPALELRHVTVIKNHVLFLVDSSSSMTLPHDGAQSRWNRVGRFLEEARPMLERPDEQHRYELFRFAEGLVPCSLEECRNTEPRGDSTRILEALEAVRESYRRSDLGGIVLISDGTDGGALGGRVHPGEELDEQTRQLIRSLGVPLHTVPVGLVDAVRDIAVTRVVVDDFAFVRNRISIEVVVTAVGFDEGQVGVTLRRNGEVLQTREISIARGQQEYRLQFEFIPQQIGKEIYLVSVPVLAGEMQTENNMAYFILEVIRDKIRVLQICGRPSWDERFLRQFLKSNPNVDLISFFILRTDANLQLVPESELSLIPFPTQEIFQDQLGSFDLVIFQNFSYRPYGMRGYLPGIERYVREGGALLMIGGEQSFSSGGYPSTPLANVLPVLLPPEGPQSALVDETPFRPVLAAGGSAHPITRLEFGPQDNQRLWEGLPELLGTNLVWSARPTATVLLEHPVLRAGEQPLPVLSVMEVDQGRTMALTVDSTWRWSFVSVARGGTTRAYSRFWNSAIRWLIQDPELKLIQVEVPQSHIAPSSVFPVSIRVFTLDYQPAAQVSGSWELVRRPLDALGEEGSALPVQSAEFVTDDRGRVDLELTVEQPGSYELSARAEVGGTGTVTDRDIFLCLNDSPEMRQPMPRPDLLRALTEASAPEARSGYELSPDDLPFAPARTVQVNRRRILDVWNSPWILLLFVLLLGTEWGLRRRWGHL